MARFFIYESSLKLFNVLDCLANYKMAPVISTHVSLFRADFVSYKLTIKLSKSARVTAWR